MTSQEKKRYLMQYRHCDAEIDRLLRERELWMARATRITPTYAGMPGGGGEQRGGAENAVLRIAEIGHEIDCRVDALASIRSDILESLDAMDDWTLRRLLELRYLDGETFEQIAVEMDKSRRHTIRLHGKALSVIECHIYPVI